MTETLDYAVVGGPPDDWADLEVIDLATGKTVDTVREVNTAEGWLVRLVLDAEGRCVLEGEGEDRHIKTERVEGRFEVRRRVNA